MKHITSLSLLLLTAATFSVQADDGRAIAFKPPQLGTPETRVGGGTRGIDLNELSKAPVTEQQQIQLQLLAAKQTGLTSSATPTLYWHVSSIPPYSVEITVQNGGKPLLKKNIGTIKTAGIQTIRLADYGVSLVSGKNYTWSVALITDPNKRTADLLANATIRYETPRTPLTDTTQMAKAGYWYDAVNQLVETNSPQLQDLLLQEDIDIIVK